MAQDLEFRDQIQTLLLSGYVQEHLVVDHFEETTAVAAELLETACLHPVHPQGLFASVDPFVALFSDLRLRDVPEFDEPWATNKDTLLRLRAVMPPNKSVLPSDAIWVKHDKPYAPSMPHHIEPVLTRGALRATLRPGIGNLTSDAEQMAKNIAPIPLRLPTIPEDDVPPDAEDSLIFQPVTLDTESKAYVLSYLHSTKSAARRGDIWMLRESELDNNKEPPAISIERPISPPLFARASRGSAHQAVLPDMKQLAQLTSKVDLPEEDLHAENMKVVSGWATLVEPMSPLPSTPPLTDGRSSEVDELTSPDRLADRLLALESPGKDKHMLHSDMDPVLIPRERRPRQGKPSERGCPSMAETLQPLIANNGVPQADRAITPAAMDAASLKTCLSDIPDGLGSPLRLQERLQLPGGDPFNLILHEQLDDNPLMEVPILPEPNRTKSIERAEFPLAALSSKRDGTLAGQHPHAPKVLKKLPIKALGMDLSWRPIKMDQDLPTFDDVCGQLEPADNSNDLQAFLWSIPHEVADAAPIDQVFAEPAPEHRADEAVDLSTILTREERRRLKRQYSPPSPPRPGALLSPFNDQRRAPKRPRVDALSSDLASSEGLFSQPLVPVSENETSAASVLPVHSNPASQLLHAPLDCESQFSALSFGTDTIGFSYPLHVPVPEALPPSDIDMDDLSSIGSFSSVELAPVAEDVDEDVLPADDFPADPPISRPPSVSVTQKRLAASPAPLSTPALHFFSGADLSLHAENGRADFAAPFDRFLQQMGKTVSSRAAPTAEPAPAPAVEMLPTALPASQITALDGPLPDEILQMQPLLLPEWHADLVKKLPPHCYLASVPFTQKRPVVSVLTDSFNVELVERDLLAPSPYVHVQFDCDSCVILQPLGSFPTQDSALANAIEGISRSVTHIGIVFECANFAFTAPVLKALRRFRRALSIAQDAMETIPADVRVELAFARAPGEAAAFVRMLGDAAAERGAGGALWDDRLWLGLPDGGEYEDEQLVAALPAMNTFAAIVMLARAGAWDGVLDMAPAARQRAFGALVGTRRIDIVNAELDERIRRFAAEELQEFSSPAR